MCLRYVTIAPARARDETFGVVMYVQKVFFLKGGNCRLLSRVALGQGSDTLPRKRGMRHLERLGFEGWKVRPLQRVLMLG
jgi:hypothetical protein